MKQAPLFEKPSKQTQFSSGPRTADSSTPHRNDSCDQPGRCWGRMGGPDNQHGRTRPLQLWFRVSFSGNFIKTRFTCSVPFPGIPNFWVQVHFSGKSHTMQWGEFLVGMGGSLPARYAEHDQWPQCCGSPAPSESVFFFFWGGGDATGKYIYIYIYIYIHMYTYLYIKIYAYIYIYI